MRLLAWSAGVAGVVGGVADDERGPSELYSLKVLGAGLGRSGTDSLRLALYEMGYGPVYHMVEVMGYPVEKLAGIAAQEKHFQYWATHDWKTPFDVERIFGKYQSGVDEPFISALPELVEVFPEAKVVLTVRTEDRKWAQSIAKSYCNFIAGGAVPGSLDDWITSFRGTEYFHFFFPQQKLLVEWGKRSDKRYMELLGLASNFTFANLCRNEDAATEFAAKWNAYVKKLVPSDRLLVFVTGKSTFVELADFLGLESAAYEGKQYPRTNSAEEFMLYRIINGVEASIPIVVPSLVLLIALYCMTRKKTKKPKSS
eukprot:CAMPEP_0184313518 /NCGR_PEP_ID=MMETSP1049-20130417/64373_1 /TAXON_ID=77928 /ORGANISM="Proteomonas sulcata, Strain CCMP704" /LENGTH=312 /DNA_ID=CAMNT_0026630823 /DNA_START=340 /DNA_END=1279 /DNA_ORIENTATION=+